MNSEMFCNLALSMLSFAAPIAHERLFFSGYSNIFRYDLSRVNSEMSCEIALSSVGFAAFVASERLLPSVRPHVALQMTRTGGSIVALVTLVWLFSCVLPHHVNFQFSSCNAGKLAHCASVRLFPRVDSFVLLQIVRVN